MIAKPQWRSAIIWRSDIRLLRKVLLIRDSVHVKECEGFASGQGAVFTLVACGRVLNFFRCTSSKGA
jgi:hypothetical protein